MGTYKSSWPLSGVMKVNPFCSVIHSIEPVSKHILREVQQEKNRNMKPGRKILLIIISVKSPVKRSARCGTGKKSVITALILGFLFCIALEYVNQDMDYG
jgi:hypothetical protein